MDTIVTPPTIWLSSLCRKNGLSITDKQISQLDQYVQLLLELNKKVNLISRKDEGNVWQYHILHSISLLFKLSFPPKVRILDLGTGGGLPGIPIKILQPEIPLTLLDSTQKKIDAVRHILEHLGLTDVEAVWGRAEEVGRKEPFRGSFDVILARAVAPLKNLVRWGQPFLKPQPQKASFNSLSQGKRVQIVPPALVALKGGDVEQEVRQVRVQSGVHNITVTDLVFVGSEHILAHDKKVVIVDF